jgi:hypothetical protein
MALTGKERELGEEQEPAQALALEQQAQHPCRLWQKQGRALMLQMGACRLCREQKL